MTSPVVTRFAPSPTGFLHIGGARTALFNWIYAKANGGKMLLRIEDTDRARSTTEAIDAILDGLTWLGLDWNDEPVFQHGRLVAHQQAAAKLLAQGKAYKCYCSPEELTAMREKARTEKRPPRYDGMWRDRDRSDAPEGIKPVIRFKSPETGATVINDQVQGRVTFNNSELDDLIILRSDGNPTYMLSVVVDDHDMGVTHVIRGDDHLTNAARQSQIFEALGWQVPVFAHIPLIHGPDGAKLSKRHGALGVDAYRDMGYLPQAMRNYLVRLGWSHGDDEIMSLESMVEWFGLDAIGRSAARFDFDKLESINGHYMRQADDKKLATAMFELLAGNKEMSDLYSKVTEEKVRKIISIMPELKERAKTLVELAASAGFILNDRPLKLSEKAVKLLSTEVKTHLKQLSIQLSLVENWNLEEIETTIRDFCTQTDVKLGSIAQPLRAALTGTTISPGIFDVLAVLGRDETLGRIADSIDAAS